MLGSLWRRPNPRPTLGAKLVYHLLLSIPFPLLMVVFEYLCPHVKSAENWLSKDVELVFCRIGAHYRCWLSAAWCPFVRHAKGPRFRTPGLTLLLGHAFQSCTEQGSYRKGPCQFHSVSMFSAQRQPLSKVKIPKSLEGP